MSYVTVSLELTDDELERLDDAIDYYEKYRMVGDERSDPVWVSLKAKVIVRASDFSTSSLTGNATGITLGT